MSLFDKIDNAPPADFNSLLRKKPKKRFLVKSPDVSEDVSSTPSPSPTPSNLPLTSTDLNSSIDTISDPELPALHHLKTSIDEIRACDSELVDLNLSIDISSVPHDNLNSSIDETRSNFTDLKMSIDDSRSEDFPVFSNIQSGVKSFLATTNSVDDPDTDLTSNLASETNSEQNKCITVNSSPVVSDNFSFRDEESTSESSNDLNSSIDKIRFDSTKSAELESSIDELRLDNSTNLKTSIDDYRATTIEYSNLSSSIDDSRAPKNQPDLLKDENDVRVYKTRFKGNFTRLTNHIFNLWSGFSKTEKLLLIYFYRQSYGWNKTETNIPLSINFLEVALPLSHNCIPAGLKKLIGSGIVSESAIVSNIGIKYELNIRIDNQKLSAPVTDYFTPLDNNFFELTKICSASDMIVYLHLYRHSYGFNQNVTKQKILTSKLAKEIGLSIRRTQDAIRNLIEQSLISRVSEISSSGIFYRVFLPQEVIPCDTKTDIEFTQIETINLNTSIDESRSLKSSIGEMSFKTFKTSIDESRSQKDEADETLGNTVFASSDLNSSIDNKSPKEIEKTNKTSSGQDDEILLFISEQTKQHPQFSFPISKKKIGELLNLHEASHLKSTFLKLLPSLLREGVGNPVGMYLHAVEKPQTYAVLQKPSTQDISDKRRMENQIELREKSFADEFKRIIDSKQESFWNGLDDRIREEVVAKRREEMGQGGELKIPEIAIKRSAIERTFWEQHTQAWQSLSTEERSAHTGNVRQSIIKRVYAGEGRAMPDPLPERDFLKSVDEIAEKLAMISVGKRDQ